MKKQTLRRSLLSVLLILSILFSLTAFVPTVSAEDAGWTVIACSDFQNLTSNEAGQTVVGEILTQVKEDYPTADGFFCCGDYTQQYESHSATAAGITALKQTATAAYPTLTDSDFVMIQGNHDISNAAGMARTGAHDCDNYGVYVINEDDFPWGGVGKELIRNAAEDLQHYLDQKLLAHDTKPIFILTHVQLHYSPRTSDGGGDGMYANYLFDIINNAAAHGLNIVFLHGHNHNGMDDYLGGGAIFLQKGDKMMVAQGSTTEYKVETLNFTYLNAGYVGYYHDSANTYRDEEKRTMTAISFDGKQLTFSRYDKFGVHNLKDAGFDATGTATGTFAPELTVYESPQTTSLNTEVLPYVCLTGTHDSRVGDSFGMTASANFPAQSYVWTVADPALAEIVESDGSKATVKVLSEGSTTISVTATAGETSESASFHITIYSASSDSGIDAGITAASFTSPAAFSFTDYSGVVGDVPFDGVRGQSSVYQPHFYFKQEAIDAIKAKAVENDCDMLRIHAYAILYNNALVLNNKVWLERTWTTMDVEVSELTTAFDFFSGSEGTTDIYLWFELFKAPIINSRSFTGAGFNFTEFSGVVNSDAFEGIKGTSSVYQPHFYFTQEAVDKIKAYAASIGSDTLRIHVTQNLYNNCFVLNNTLWSGNNSWHYLDVPISDISTSFDFWSQSEGLTEVYLWFEFVKSPLINAASFSGSGWTFTNVIGGTVADKTFDGVKGSSSAYQPRFYFTQAGVDAIKTYAEANGFDTMRLWTNADQYNNGFVVNGVYSSAHGGWTYRDVAIEDLSTAYSFWSQSEGASTVYLFVEFPHEHSYTETVVDPTCLEDGYTEFTCACGDSYKDSYVPALGHDVVADAAVEPDCTNPGLTAGEHCTRCDYCIAQKEISALGHDYVADEENSKVPTCSDDGVIASKCSRCGDVQIEPIGALGHDFVDGICSRCGDEDPNYVKPDPCEGYTDIDRSKWYHEAADFVIERGIMGSTQTDALTFEPTTSCTRSMIVMILYNLAGNPDVEYEAKFPDVPNGQWYTKAVMWAHENGIVSGYDNGKFGPNDKVTREQMAVVLKGYADFLGIDTSKTADLSKFPDGNKATWSKAYISWAVAAGLISGKAQNGQTYLDPQGVASRAEVAALIRGFVLNILGE